MLSVTNYLYEYRTTKIRRDKVRLVQEETLQDLRGFRSMYGYPQEVVDLIIKYGSTADLGGLPVYSNTLLVDFDDCPEDGHRMAEALREYNWTKWDSGGRSIHIHVDIVPMLGEDVPHQQKAWMQKHFPKADMSIYRTSGIYRLPLTYHEKHPGKLKHLLEVNSPGKLLTIEKVELPAPNWEGKAVSNGDLGDMLMHLLNMTVHQGTTGRNYHVYKIGRVCCRLGMAPKQAWKIIHDWNIEKCMPALNNSSIDTTIKSAYKEHYNGNKLG